MKYLLIETPSASYSQPTLNAAGPRASKEPEIEEFAKEVVDIFSLDRASHEHCALAPKALQDLVDELEASRQPRNRCCACNLDSSESIRSLAA